ncbi:uncharacterized protein TNCV_608211 [Trichonephila clavipes]|nr:uncharacterized protein TNCV_608211 [Trichonephila clavipes]
MEVDGMLRIFNRSEKLHNLKYSNYIGDGDTKTFNALSENKPYGDDHLIQKIECVGHVQKRMGTRLRKLKLVYSKNKLSDGKTIGGKGRLTDSLIDKLAHYYGNAIRCNSTSVKEMRKAIWAVWGHSCSTDDEPMHWFCPTNPNTWCKYNAAINNNLQNYKHKPSVAKAVRDVIKPVFADLSHPALLKKCLGVSEATDFFLEVPQCYVREQKPLQSVHWTLLWLPQLEEMKPNAFFQLDGDPVIGIRMPMKHFQIIGLVEMDHFRSSDVASLVPGDT